MKKNKEYNDLRRPLPEIEKEYDKFETTNACSAHDCTGLIPTPPATDEEMESYMEIYDYRAPDVQSPDDKKLAEENKK